MIHAWTRDRVGAGGEGTRTSKRGTCSFSVLFALPVTSVALLLVVSAVPGNAAPIDMTNGTVIQYDHVDGQSDATWNVISSSMVQETTNADASIYQLDDITNIQNTRVTGTMEVQTTSDDDLIGFAFGIQDRGSYYLFDWKQATQTDLPDFGTADVGMSVKLVNTGGSDPSGFDLWNTGNNTGVSLLADNDVAWADNTVYGFTLDFLDGSFDISITEGITEIGSFSIVDSTFTGGGFGLYAYSQRSVKFSDLASSPVSVPEPSSLLVLSIGLAGLARWARRHRVATVS